MRGVLPVAAVVLGLMAAHQSSPSIVIDGEFDDWVAVPVAIDDPADTPAGLDFRAIRTAANDRFIFVQVDFERAVNVEKLSGTLELVIDLDGLASTGQPAFGVPGVDLSLQLSPEARSGVAVRRPTNEPGRGAWEPWSAVTLALAPAHSSNRLELRIDRGTARAAVLKLVFHRGGEVVDDTGEVRIALPQEVPGPAPLVVDDSSRDDPLQRAPNTSFRVVAWNVQALSSLTRDRKAAILAALDPDLLLLTEVTPPDLTPADLERWLSGVSSTDAPWQVFTDRRSDSAIAARVDAEPLFVGADYLPGGLEALFGLTSAANSTRNLTGLDDRGVATVGVLTRIGGARLLSASVHMACCGSPENVSEALRSLEAQALHEAVKRASIEARPDAVLIGGDFNLVGTRDPLDVVQRGLDLDGSSLTPVYARQLDGLSADTWRNPRGEGVYPPSRIDWILYSDSTLEVLRAFVFDSEDISSGWLERKGLQRSDSSRSDHLPVVADFRWRR